MPRVAKTGVAYTSREALETVNVPDRRAEVLRAVKALAAEGKRPSDREIAAWLGWTINRVTPRRGELEADGLIYRAGLKRDPDTGRRCAVWLPFTRPTQLLLDMPGDLGHRGRSRPRERP